MAKGQHVLLTGPPGIGKTTLVRRIVEELLQRQVTVSGFFTEEVRDVSTGKRSGFDVVTLDDRRATLASVQSKSNIKVGNYGVEIGQFESTALPSIEKSFPNSEGVLVIDEIGKMELFSTKFKTAIEKSFAQSNAVILATIPIPKGKPIPFVEKIRSTPGAKLFTVDRSNRNGLLDEILKTLLGHS